MTESSDQDIILKAATILQHLTKPREEISLTDEGISIAKDLKKRGLVHSVTLSSMPEQTIWMINAEGIRWLYKHGLMP